MLRARQFHVVQPSFSILADERAVARRHQPRGHRVVEVGGRRLERRVIEARVEQVAAAAPQRRVDPRMLAVGSLRPGRAAFPRRTLGERRRARIDDARLELRAGRERRGERDAELSLGIGIRRRRERLAVDGDLGDRELGKEIEDQRADRRLGPEAQRRHALDALVVREDLQREIEVIEDERQLLGGHRAAHLACLRGDVLRVAGIGDRPCHLPLRVQRGNRHRRAHHCCPDRRVAHGEALLLADVVSHPHEFRATLSPRTRQCVTISRRRR